MRNAEDATTSSNGKTHQCQKTIEYKKIHVQHQAKNTNKNNKKITSDALLC